MNPLKCFFISNATKTQLPPRRTPGFTTNIVGFSAASISNLDGILIKHPCRAMQWPNLLQNVLESGFLPKLNKRSPAKAGFAQLTASYQACVSKWKRRLSGKAGFRKTGSSIKLRLFGNKGYNRTRPSTSCMLASSAP